jgi:hypothetical protein
VSEGSITLGDVAEHTTVLAVACRRCDQAGRYNVDTLIARHGEGFGIPNLLRLDPSSGCGLLCRARPPESVRLPVPADRYHYGRSQLVVGLTARAGQMAMRRRPD